MAVLKQAKDASRRWVIRQMVKLLPKLTMDNMETMISLGQKLLKNPEYIQTAESLKQYIRERHPAVKVVEKVLYDLSPEARFRTIYDLFIKGLLYGTTYREEVAEDLGFRPPLFFVISPTMRCNLKCYGCYSGEYDQDYGLSTELLDRIFTEAEELGMAFITVSGGEPFIRKDLLDLFENHKEMMFQVYTNGTLIDEEMAKRLAKMGNVAPMISVEGFEEITDGRRGKGHFKKIMKAMDYLRDEGVLFGASVCQTRKNYLEVSSEEFADLMAEKGVFLIWHFQYIPIGREPDLSLMLTPEMRDTIRRRLRFIRNNWPFFICDFWNDGPYVDGCIAGGREYFHINANGDVEPCVFVHFAVDNIKEKSLKEALNSDFFKDIRAHQPWSDNPLCPCMIIDNPHCLRDMVKRHRPIPTHVGAEKIVNELALYLDEYAQSYHRIAHKAWNEEYAEEYGKYL